MGNITERDIMKEIDAQPQQIGWLGPRGTFTEKAARLWRVKIGEKKYSLAPVHSPNITTIFQGVLNGTIDVGIVPIENTTGGPVKDTHMALEGLDGISIVGELVLPIKQYAYYQPDAQVKKVASKDQALIQSSIWIGYNYPTATLLETESTSKAVQMAAEDTSVCAIAGDDTAKELGLQDRLTRSTESVENNKANATTFVAITKRSESPEPTGNDKTTLILELSDQPGSLYRALNNFKERGINLTKIKSLKSVNGEIRFLISIDGHQKEEKVNSALESLTDARVKTLGSYPKDSYAPKEKVESNMANAIAMIKKEAQNGNVANGDNSTIVFNLPNEVGTLANILRAFAKRDINLTKIDSMPSGNFEEYIFYLSFNKNDVKDQDSLFKELVNRSRDIVQLQ